MDELSTRKVKMSQIIDARQEGIIVFEDIHDPHNAGAVLRTCEAFGFQKVHYIFENEKYYNPKKIGKSSSASANKWLDISTFTSAENCFESLQSKGYTIYATTLSPQKKVNLYENLPTLGPKIAIVFGNEYAGISQYASAHSDYHLYIPMRGFVQSLNISVCAGLVLGEITRRRVEEGIGQYLLPTTEKSVLHQKWQ
jgi:tRNA (guanosine-2'-O-)-methyltransferase